MFIKSIQRRQRFAHRIRVGDGIVIMISDPGKNFRPGEEICIILSNLNQLQFRVAIDAPAESTPLKFEELPLDKPPG